jgi:hypothetical protein
VRTGLGKRKAQGGRREREREEEEEAGREEREGAFS